MLACWKYQFCKYKDTRFTDSQVIHTHKKCLSWLSLSLAFFVHLKTFSFCSFQAEQAWYFSAGTILMLVALIMTHFLLYKLFHSISQLFHLGVTVEHVFHSTFSTSGCKGVCTLACTLHSIVSASGCSGVYPLGVYSSQSSWCIMWLRCLHLGVYVSQHNHCISLFRCLPLGSMQFTEQVMHHVVKVFALWSICFTTQSLYQVGKVFTPWEYAFHRAINTSCG